MINNLNKTEFRILKKMSKFKKPQQAVIESFSTPKDVKSKKVKNQVLEILNNSKLKATKRLELITQKLYEK